MKSEKIREVVIAFTTRFESTKEVTIRIGEILKDSGIESQI